MKKLYVFIITIFLSFSFRSFASDSIKQIGDVDFEKSINSKNIVIVDFWATWCYPCKVQGNILENMLDRLPKNVQVYKLDIDKNRVTADMYGIRSIPTLIFFRNGKIERKYVGVMEESDILEIIDDLKIK